MDKFGVVTKYRFNIIALHLCRCRPEFAGDCRSVTSVHHSIISEGYMFTFLTMEFNAGQLWLIDIDDNAAPSSPSYCASLRFSDKNFGSPVPLPIGG